MLADVYVCVWADGYCVGSWSDYVASYSNSAISPDIQPQTLNIEPQKPHYYRRPLSTTHRHTHSLPNTSLYTHRHTNTQLVGRKKNPANCCDVYRFAFICWQQKLFLMLAIHLPISTSLFRLYAAYTQFNGICSLSCFQLVLPWRKLYWLLHHNIWLIHMPICDDSAVTIVIRRSQMGY